MELHAFITSAPYLAEQSKTSRCPARLHLFTLPLSALTGKSLPQKADPRSNEVLSFNNCNNPPGKGLAINKKGSEHDVDPDFLLD